VQSLVSRQRVSDAAGCSTKGNLCMNEKKVRRPCD
jgi:hypothetical protein